MLIVKVGYFCVEIAETADEKVNFVDCFVVVFQPNFAGRFEVALLALELLFRIMKLFDVNCQLPLI